MKQKGDEISSLVHVDRNCCESDTHCGVWNCQPSMMICDELGTILLALRNTRNGLVSWRYGLI